MQRFIGIIVGIAILGIGAFLYYRNSNLVKNCTVEVEATVVDMKQELTTDSDGYSDYLYYPIVEYIVDDNTVRTKLNEGTSTPAYDINEKITILYNPNNVKQFIVKGEKGSKIMSIVFLVIGTLLIGYGVKMAIKKD